jgi:acyl dehydratase
MTGRYFEDFTAGEVIVHRPSRTVTEADNVLFCSLTMNPQPLHLDHEFAASTVHGRPVVNGIFTLGLMLGLSVNDTTLGTTVGNLGFGEIAFPAPVFVGDTITAETEVLGKRVSASRPGTGIVKFAHRARNQDGTLVVTCVRSAMMLFTPTTVEST